jgi:IMP cyclohydrolase
MDGFGSDVDRTNGFNRKEDVRAALIHREKNVSSNNPLATYKCTRVSLKLLRCGFGIPTVSGNNAAHTGLIVDLRSKHLLIPVV